MESQRTLIEDTYRGFGIIFIDGSYEKVIVGFDHETTIYKTTQCVGLLFDLTRLLAHINSGQKVSISNKSCSVECSSCDRRKVCSKHYTGNNCAYLCRTCAEVLNIRKSKPVLQYHYTGYDHYDYSHEAVPSQFMVLSSGTNIFALEYEKNKVYRRIFQPVDTIMRRCHRLVYLERLLKNRYILMLKSDLVRDIVNMIFIMWRDLV